MAEKKDLQIIAGSGEIYMMEFTGEIPEDAEIETAKNQYGYTKGGATLTYSITSETIQDDMGHVTKIIYTEDSATFAFGLFSWCGKTLKKLCPTCRITEGENKRTVKIGGIQNDDGINYLVRFVHKDKVKGNVRITIVGKNTADLAMAFAPDDGTMLEPEFTATPMDDEGTKIIYEEEMDAA